MKRLPDTDRLESQLIAVGRSLQAQFIHRGFIALLTGACVLFLAAFAADWMTRFPYALRVGVVVTGILYGLYWFKRRALGPAARKLEAQEVSILVEKAEPGLQSRLISTLQWQEKRSIDPGTSENLVDGMIDQTFDMLASVQMGKVVDTSWRGKAIRKLFLAAALVAGIALLAPTYTMAFLQRLVLPEAQYPTLTSITDVQVPSIIPLGDPISISVTGDGRIPELGRVILETADGEYIEYDLHPEQPGSPVFVANLAALSHAATMTIELGDAEAGPLELDPIARPALERITAVIKSPAYTGTEERQEQTGNLRVLEGSSIDFTFVTSKSCPEFILRSTTDDGAPLPAAVSTDGTTWTASVSATDSIGFTLAMTDEIGLAATDVPQYRITVIRDRSPVVKIEKPDGASEMAPVSRVPLEFTITDDIGLSEIRIEYVVQNEDENDDQFGVVVSRSQARKTYTSIPNIGKTTYTFNDWWENSKVDVRPGQVIRFWIIATDNAPTAHVTESDEQLIRVISSEEYRRVLWQKLGEHIERVDELVPEIKESGRQLEDVRTRME